MRSQLVYCAECHVAIEPSEAIDCTVAVVQSNSFIRRRFPLSTGWICSECRSRLRLPKSGWLVPLPRSEVTLEEIRDALRKALEELE